jgi:hypothetical protein
MMTQEKVENRLDEVTARLVKLEERIRVEYDLNTKGGGYRINKIYQLEEQVQIQKAVKAELEAILRG